MLVKDLIEQLKNYPADANVIIDSINYVNTFDTGETISYPGAIAEVAYNVYSKTVVLLKKG